jgi:hypothetical protein
VTSSGVGVKLPFSRWVLGPDITTKFQVLAKEKAYFRVFRWTLEPFTPMSSGTALSEIPPVSLISYFLSPNFRLLSSLILICPPSNDLLPSHQPFSSLYYVSSVSFCQRTKLVLNTVSPTLSVSSSIYYKPQVDQRSSRRPLDIHGMANECRVS